MAVHNSMKDFFKELRAVQDKSLRELLQLRYVVAQRILEEAQENVKANFGGGNVSEITLRARGSSARRSGRGGGLLGSGHLERGSNGAIDVVFGGPGVPYAAIHEYGGVIRPKNSRFLTIPFAPQYSGKRAREFSLKMGFDPEHGRVLKTTGGEIAYLLRERVTIPERPYLKPARDKVAKDKIISAMLKRMMDGTAGVEVK